MSKLTRTARSRLQTWANVSRIQSEEETYGLVLVGNHPAVDSGSDRRVPDGASVEMEVLVNEEPKP